MSKYLSLLLPIVWFFGATPIFFAADSSIEFNQTQFLLFSSGKSLTETVSLSNRTDKIVEVNLSWVPYSQSKTKAIATNFLSKHSIDFATITETKISLQPFETKPITIVFTVPNDIASGDHYGTLKARDGLSEVESKYTLRVLGKLNETINGNSFFRDGKIEIEISNPSNKTTRIETSGEISGIFGNSAKFSFPKQNIRAGEIVSLQTQDLKLLPGYYQSRIDIKYSDRNLQKVLIVSFWVHPEILIVSFLTLLLSFLGFIYFRRALKPNVN